MLVGGSADVAAGIGPTDGPAPPGAGGTAVTGTAGAGRGVPVGAARELPPLPLHPGAVCRAAPLRQGGLVLGEKRGVLVSTVAASTAAAGDTGTTHTPRGR